MGSTIPYYYFLRKNGNKAFEQTFDEAKPFSEGLAAISIDKKWGYVDKQGNLKIPPTYTSASSFKEGKALVKIDKNAFLIDKNGKVVLNLPYKNVNNFKEGRAGVENEAGKWGFIDSLGNVVIDFQYQHTLLSFYEGLCAVQKQGKMGYIDKQGQKIIPPQFEQAMPFFEGMACVQMLTKDQQKHFGFINQKGKIVINPAYEQAYRFSEGLASVRQAGKFGYINKKGKLIIPCLYDQAQDFHEGLACVKLQGKWGIIDAKGDWIVRPKYEQVNVYGFSDELLGVKIRDKWGMINKKGNPTLPTEYASNRVSFDLYHCQEDLILAYAPSEKVLIDRKGKVTMLQSLGYTYPDWGGFSNGLIILKKNDKWGALDSTLQVKIPFEYDSLGRFNENRCVAVWQGKYVYLNEKGERINEMLYDTADRFRGERAIASIDNHYFFIDKGGSIVFEIPRNRGYLPNGWNSVATNTSNDVWIFKENDLLGFSDNNGNVMQQTIHQALYFNEHHIGLMRNKNFKYGLINKQGEIVLPHKYERLGLYSEGLFAAKENGLWGFIDEKGNYIIPPKYEDDRFYFPNEMRNGLVAVKKNGLFGFINVHDEAITPFKYKRAYQFEQGFAYIEINGREGFLDTQGREYFSPTLDIRTPQEGFCIASRAGKFGILYQPK